MGDRMSDATLLAKAVYNSAQVAEVVVGHGALTRIAAVYQRHFSGPACLIADQNTWAAAGKAVAAELLAAGVPFRTYVLPALPRPKPSVELAEAVQAIVAQDDSTPVSIGSGVLNDLVKYAAFRLDRPYLCVATACSMDGYTSAGAPLSDKGFKMTIACRPARVVLADLDVLCAAPPAMTGWGYGDLAGKVAAGGDWIIADELEIEKIDAVAWPMVQNGLNRWLGQPRLIRSGDPEMLAGLFTGLTIVGLAMEAHGSSRPASGAEHQIAHLWEMDDLQFAGERVSHGACVAVATVAVLRLYDWLLNQNLRLLDVAAIVAAAPDMGQKEAAIRDAFGSPDIAARATEETRAKHIGPDAHRARLDHLREIWPPLRRLLRGRLTESPTMAAMLHLAGAPAEAAEIGVDRAHLRQTILNARFLRSRYTVLDLLDDTGLLEQAVDATLPA